ncbi:MAG TPA: UDP-3-O-(3-hydroxymyristoyl)glucosamine N-acyltransferase [Acidobacteria bacterium]|nr:UDP-3-O-(3-hydroxymyristoyl)glucosamine N-acyltransferase [Acidobacteriota bacterium]
MGGTAHRLADLAGLIGGQVEGDPDREVEAIRPLEAAGPRDLSFLNHPRYRAEAVASRAAALLVGRDLAAGLRDGAPARDLLVVAKDADVPLALARLLAVFHAVEPPRPGIHPTAVVEAGCTIDPSAWIGPYAVIGAGATVAARVQVHPHVVLGAGCSVGEGTVLHPHAVLYPGTEVGSGCIVHAGAVLGADGFGYATSGGMHHKVPQVGRVVLERDVEVGAGSTIDRATLGETRIGAGTKIDNLVQIGHNVQTGRHCILCGQSGIAGSTRLGDYVVLAGQAGVSGHIHLGTGVQVAAKSAALHAVEAGQKVAGIPAVELKRWKRQTVLLARLEDMSRRLRALERGASATGGPAGDPEEGGD